MNKITSQRAQQLVVAFKLFQQFDMQQETANRAVKSGIIDEATSKEFIKHGIRKVPADKIDKVLNIGLKTVPINPIFFVEDKEIKTHLKYNEFFELYNFSNAVSTFCRGVNQYTASKLLVDNRHYQFGFVSHYSSIYNLITSFLNVHGINFIFNPVTDFKHEVVKRKVISEEKNTKRVAEITKNTPVRLRRSIRAVFDSKWNFSFTKFKHELKWKDFGDEIKRYLDRNWETQIPENVVRFFGFLDIMDDYKRHMFLQENRYYPVEFASKDRFAKAISKSYGMMPEWRHKALYEDRGFSLMEYPYLQKGQRVPDGLTESRFQFIREMNEAMINWNCDIFLFMLKKVQTDIGKQDYLEFIEEISNSAIVHLAQMEIRTQDLREFLERQNGVKKIVPSLIELFLC